MMWNWQLLWFINWIQIFHGKKQSYLRCSKHHQQFEYSEKYAFYLQTRLLWGSKKENRWNFYWIPSSKWYVTGGQTDQMSIICSIIQCAKLNTKVILSIMKFFYLFVSCLLCNCPRRLCKVSRCRNNHSTVYQTHEPTSRDIMSRVCGEHSTSRRQVPSW